MSAAVVAVVAVEASPVNNAALSRASHGKHANIKQRQNVTTHDGDHRKDIHIKRRKTRRFVMEIKKLCGKKRVVQHKVKLGSAQNYKL